MGAEGARGREWSCFGRQRRGAINSADGETASPFAGVRTVNAGETQAFGRTAADNVVSILIITSTVFI
ncbi:MAG: hypothetical protein V3V55_01195 [Rhodospirillales bacterium]